MKFCMNFSFNFINIISLGAPPKILIKPTNKKWPHLLLLNILFLESNIIMQELLYS